jgi:hypothetical protein
MVVHPVIPALRRQRQEDLKFKVSLDYVERFCLKKEKKGVGGAVAHASNLSYARGRSGRMVV